MEWVRHIRGVIFSQRGVVGEILVGPVLVRENRIGAIARQRIVEIVLQRCVEA